MSACHVSASISAFIAQQSRDDRIQDAIYERATEIFEAWTKAQEPCLAVWDKLVALAEEQAQREYEANKRGVKLL